MTNFHLKIPLSTASFAALFCIYLPFHSLCPFILYLAKSDLHNKRRVERRVERRDEKKSVYKGCSGRLHTRSMRYATQRKSRATWPIQDTSQARLRYEGKHKERERKQENGTKKDKRRPGQLRSWRPDLHIINLWYVWRWRHLFCLIRSNFLYNASASIGMKTSTCPYPKQDQSVPTDIHVLLYEDITHKEGLARATISVSLFITQTKTKNQNALTRLVAALPQKRPVPPPTAAKTGMEIPNVKNAGRMPKPPPIVVPTMVPIPPPIWAHVFAVSLAKEAVEVSGPSEELTSTCLLTISDWTRRLPTWLTWLISCKSFFLIRSSTRSASSCISFKHLNTRQLRSRSVLRAPQCAWLSKTNVINTFSETTMKSKNSHRFCTIW